MLHKYFTISLEIITTVMNVHRMVKRIQELECVEISVSTFLVIDSKTLKLLESDTFCMSEMRNRLIICAELL